MGNRLIESSFGLNVKREALIDGSRVRFDAYSSKTTLKEAQDSYTPEKWRYVGTGKTAYYNGKRSTFSGPLFFFVLKSKDAKESK